MSSKRVQVRDMKHGVYRRQYSGFMTGKRINSVSLEAEAWFWRAHSAADDFGNMPADRQLLYGMTAGRRAGSVPLEKTAAMLDELESAGLLLRYQAEGDDFLHVAGWTELQTAPANGRMVRRMPASPWDLRSDDPELAAADARDQRGTKSRKSSTGNGSVEKGESGGIRKAPEDSGGHHHHDHHHDQDKNKAPAARAAVEIAAGVDSSAAGNVPEDATLFVFPCDGTPATWQLKQSYVDQLQTLFPALHLLAECRAAYAWVISHPRGKKTAGGMKAYLTGWMTKSTNNPRMRAKPDDVVGSAGGRSYSNDPGQQRSHGGNTANLRGARQPSRVLTDAPAG